MTYEDIRVSEEGHRATITLDIPPVNVLSLRSIEELQRAFEALDEPDRRAIVVTGGGEKMFSGGVEVEDHIGEQLPVMMEAFGDLFETMRSIETPTVAKVEGPALGGGCEVVAGCDLAIASEQARFGQPEMNLGTFPPIAAALFPQMVGEKRAFEIIFTGEQFGATEAEAMGLINRVVPPNEVDSATEDVVDTLLSKSGLVVGMAKRAFYETAAADRDEAIATATHYGIEITDTVDGQEGLTAFVEDREPAWQF